MNRFFLLFVISLSLTTGCVSASDSLDTRTFTTSGTINAGDRVKAYTAGVVIQAGASDEAIGTALQTTTTGKLVSIKLTHRVSQFTTSSAISFGASVYPSATGQVSATSGTGRRLGIALNATTTSGDLIDVAMIPPDDVVAGGSAATFRPQGILSAQATASVNTADTNENTLFTYSLPANTLSAVGKTVKVIAWGVTSADANNKTVKIYFGTASFTTGAAAANNKAWFVEARITKTGTNTQTIIFSGSINGADIAPTVVSGTDTDTGAIVIKCTGTNGTAAASQITANCMLIEAAN
jgi:hypothetical protein